MKDLRHNMNGAYLKTAKWTTKITHAYAKIKQNNFYIYNALQYGPRFKIKKTRVAISTE